MTDNESEIEKVVRSLSFQVLAVPGQCQKVIPSSSSKATPLNIKIKVRKKHEGGLQHGVFSTPIKGRDEVPQRIRLVSSDQTIMSFNAVMEDIDFDKSREQNSKLPNIGNHPYTLSTTGSFQSQGTHKEEYLLSKVKNYPNNKKYNIFGRCKPGGCLDPPFGEDKYTYAPEQQLNIKSTSEKKKTSSIFSNKLLRKIKKSKTDKSNVKNKETESNQSVISLYQSGSLQRSIYSNSIITYPSPEHGSDEKISDDKSKSPRNSQIRKSTASENGSLYIVSKKTRASLEMQEAKSKFEKDNTKKKNPMVLRDQKRNEYLISEKQNYGDNVLRTGPKTQESDDLVNGTLESEQDATTGAKTALISASVTEDAVVPITQEYLYDDLVDGALETKLDVTGDKTTSGAKAGFISTGFTRATCSMASTFLADVRKKETTPDDIAVSQKTQEYLSGDLVDGTIESKRDVTGDNARSGAKAGLISGCVTVATAGGAATVLADIAKKKTTPDITVVGPITQEYLSGDLVYGTLESNQDVTGDNSTSRAKAGSISAGVTAATPGFAVTVLTDKTKKKTTPDDTAKRKSSDNESDNIDFKVLLQRDKEIINTISNEPDKGKAAYLNTKPNQLDVTDNKINEKEKCILRTESTIEQYLSKEQVDSIPKSTQHDTTNYATSAGTAVLIPTSIAAPTASVAATVLADKTKIKTTPDDTALIKPSDNKNLGINNTISNEFDQRGAISLNNESQKYEIADTDNKTKYEERHTLRTVPEIQKRLQNDPVNSIPELKQNNTGDNTRSRGKSDFNAASVAAATTIDDTSTVKLTDNDDEDLKVGDSEVNKTDEKRAGYLNSNLEEHKDTDDKINHAENNMVLTGPEIQDLELEQGNTGDYTTSSGKADFIPASVASTTVGIAATLLADSNKNEATLADDTTGLISHGIDDKDFKVSDSRVNMTIFKKSDGQDQKYLNIEPQKFETTGTDIKKKYDEKNWLRTDSAKQEYLPKDQFHIILKSKQDNTENNMTSRSEAKNDNDTNKTISNVPDKRETGHLNTARLQNKLNDDNYKEQYELHTDLDVQEYLSNDLVDSTLTIKQVDTNTSAKVEGIIPSTFAAATTESTTIVSADSKYNIKKTSDYNFSVVNLSHDDKYNIMFDKNKTVTADKTREIIQSDKRDNTPSGNESGLMSPRLITATSGVVATRLASSFLDINTLNKTTFCNTSIGNDNEANASLIGDGEINKDYGSIKDEKVSYSENFILPTSDSNIEEGNKDNQNISVKDDNMSKHYEDILSDFKSQNVAQEKLEKENELIEVGETHQIDDTIKWKNVSEFKHINGKLFQDNGENDEIIQNDVVKSLSLQPGKKRDHSNTDDIFQSDRIISSLKKPITTTSDDRHKKGSESDKQFKTKIDLGFHTFTDIDKELIVKSFDSRTIPNRYPNDSVIIAKCDLKDPFHLKVPFGTDQYLSVQIKENENLTKNIPGTSKISLKGKERNIRKHQIINEQINSTVKNATRAVKLINKDIVKAHMKDIYGTYENELVPVQRSLTRLKRDIDSLILQQKIIRSNLLSKRSNIVGNRKCGCVKKL